MKEETNYGRSYHLLFKTAKEVINSNIRMEWPAPLGNHSLQINR
jgi:hypothetical protein